jgi:hypothetical protein
MTKRSDLPEEARREPRILSPKELADRATRALEQTDALEAAGEDPSLADSDNPLRMPGELSARPREPRPSRRW